MPTNDTGVKNCKVEGKEDNFGTTGRDLLPFGLQIRGCQGVTMNYIGMKPSLSAVCIAYISTRALFLDDFFPLNQVCCKSC